MKMKRIIAAALSVVLLTSTFAGCGKDDDSSSKADKSTGDKVILKVLTHRTDRLEDGSLDKMTDAFEAANNCIVEYQGFTAYADDVTTMMNTKDYGDVLMIPDTIKLEDIGNFFASLGTTEELNAKYMWGDKKAFDGKVYGIAHAGTVSGVLYNKKVWADAGITTLPTTPDEFIACLQKIADNTEAIPLYTNYAAGWVMAQWQSLVVGASGNPDFNNDLLTEKTDLFADGGAYDTVYSTMYKIFANPDLHEADPSTTDWEGCKPAFGEGKIATLVLGSWAISQFQATAGDNVADIGYMPFPATVDGKIFSVSAPDYNLGVNKNSSNIELGKKYITWFVEESGFAASEGMISPVLGAAMPETLASFDELGVELITEITAPDALVGKFDQIDKDAEIGTWLTDAGNFKLAMAEAAFAGKPISEYKDIIAKINTKWSTKRDEVLG